MTDADQRDLVGLESRMLDVLNDLHRLRMRMVQSDHTLQKAPQLQSAFPSDLMELGTAAQIARRPCDTVRSWCRANPIDIEAGFAMKLKARWFVSRRPFVEFLRARPQSR